MAYSSESAFSKAFDDFIAKLRPYNARQRKEIYQLFIKATSNILATFPAPRPDCEDPLSPLDGAIEPDTNSNNNDTDNNDARIRKLVNDFELILNDRMYALGHDKSLFQRFDPKLTGFVNSDQFRAVSAILGVMITDMELKGIVNKYDIRRDGTICYDDLIKVLLALREVPRASSSDAFSRALVGRQIPNQSLVDELIAKAKATDPLEIRIERGLKALRDNMYLKSSNFHSIFQALQNDHKTVSVDQVIPQLVKLGFPQGTCTDQELRVCAQKYALDKPGELTYQEFLSFFLGHDPAPQVANVPVTFSDQPNLIQALVKMNHMNLRKLFKDLDSDGDACITSDELIHLLTEHGLNDTFKRDNNFKEYVETFSQKKKGLFTYAEFVKFANQRLQQSGLKSSGQLAATSTAPPTIINDSMTASEIMDSIVTRTRTSGVSVESVLKHFDSNDDGILDVSEFYQALCELGFQISNQLASTLFHTFDSNVNGLEISDFAKTVANPFRNGKLSVRVRHAPGGESSIAFGSSYNNPDSGSDTPRKVSSIRVVQTPTREASFDISTQLNADNTSGEDRPSIKPLQPIGGSTNIDLSYNSEEAPARIPRPDSRGTLEGGPPPVENNTNNNNNRMTSLIPDAIAFEKPKGRPPPGGASSISFTSDHGFTPSRSSIAVGEKKNNGNILSFDPNTPAESVSKPRPHTAGGHSSIVLSDTIDEAATISEANRPAFAVLQSPGGNSSISFSSEIEKHKPIQRVLASPGGNSSFRLTHDEAATPATPNASRPQDKLNIDLTFDPTRSEAATPKRLWKAVNGASGAETNIQIAHPHRNEANAIDDNTDSRARRPVENGGTGISTMTSIGSDDAAHVLNQYKTRELVPVDMTLLAKIGDVIYAHSQRLRHTFQEFTKGVATSLSKEQFKEGMKILGMNVEDDQINALYARFDADLDGAITYSEFVRMLSTKE